MKAVFSSAVLSVLLFAARSLVAQPPECHSTVLVAALDDKTTEPIDGLNVADLRAKMNGRELLIRSITPAPVARRLVVVLDRSGSMTNTNTPQFGAPYENDVLAERAVADLLGKISDSSTVAFLAFSGQGSNRTEFMSPPLALQKLPEMLAFKPSGKGHRTPLWDNIEVALRMLSPHQEGDVLIVATDGGDNASKTSMHKVMAELLSAGIPVLEIVNADPYAPSPELWDAPARFAPLAEATGGAAALADVRLTNAFTFQTSFLPPDRLVPLLAHQYELQLDAPPIQKPAVWKLEFKSAHDGGKVRLLYPNELPPCAAAQ